MREAAHLLLALAIGGALCTAAAGFQLSASSDTAPGSCVANPEHPFEAEHPELGACKACNAPDNTTCVECWPIFSLSDVGECIRCNASYCLECRPDEPEFCLTCGDYWGESETGYYATEDGECLPCPVENCMECQNFNGTCTGCNTYMGLIDGECQACSDTDHCLNCDGDVDVCKECGPGTFLEGGRCKPCPDNCFKCSSSTACEECESQGYFLESSTRLCAACPAGCLSCKAASTCEQCDTGSGWTNMSSGPPCAPCTDAHCTTCTPDMPDNCTICASTAADDWFGGPNARGACVPCAMDNCQACQTNHAVCDWCTDGYFNDAQLGECTPCEDRWPHCTSCGLDATQSQPGIPACFGCEEGWQNDEGQPDKPCVRAPPSPPSA